MATEISSYEIIRESVFQKYSPLYGFGRRMSESPLELIALQNRIAEDAIKKREYIQMFANQLSKLMEIKQ